MTFELTEEQLEEILEAYKLRSDDSYCIHVAYIIWEILLNKGIISSPIEDKFQQIFGQFKEEKD